MTMRRLEALGRRYPWLHVQRSENGKWTIYDSGSFASKTLAIAKTLPDAVEQAMKVPFAKKAGRDDK